LFKCSLTNVKTRAKKYLKIELLLLLCQKELLHPLLLNLLTLTQDQLNVLLHQLRDLISLVRVEDDLARLVRIIPCLLLSPRVEVVRDEHEASRAGRVADDHLILKGAKGVASPLLKEVNPALIHGEPQGSWPV